MRTVILACFALAACNQEDRSAGDGRSDGASTVRSFAIRDFTAVDLRGPDNVDIVTSDSFAVVAQGDSETLDKLEIVRDGDSLRIGRKGRTGFRWGGGDGNTARIRVTMPAVRSATLAGSGDMAIDRASNGFEGAVAGSGDMVIGQLRGGKVALSVAGSGTLAAAGQVDRIEMNIAGSGDISAAGVRASEAEVAIAGSGDATADVSGDADVSLIGSGSATLGPNARCTVSKLGSGQANCG